MKSNIKKRKKSGHLFSFLTAFTLPIGVHDSSQTGLGLLQQKGKKSSKVNDIL